MRVGEGGRRYCRKRQSRRRDAPQALLIGNAMQRAAVRLDAPLPLRPDCVRLTQEQQDVVAAVVVKRQSVFLTGSAGTGKSFLVSYLVDALVARDGADAVAATAPTAAAARLLPGGVTLASFGGYGMLRDDGTIEDLRTMMANILACKPARARWEATTVVVIDEISMVPGDLFEALHIIAGLIRKRPGEFFGGIQLITSGDFFQLPPPGKLQRSRPIDWAFEAPCWQHGGLRHLQLTTIFRQREAELLAVLEEVRWGRLTETGQATLEGRVAPTGHPSAMRVLATRAEVKSANDNEFKSRSGVTHTCVMRRPPVPACLPG